MALFRKVRIVPESLLAFVAFLFIPLLPRPAIVALARRAGKMAYRLSNRLRSIALANLDLAFGDTISRERKEEIALESFRISALVSLDLFWFVLFRKSRFQRIVRFDPSFDCYFNSSPVVAVTAHLGNWEVMGQAAALRGDPPTSVAAPLKNPIIDRFLTWLRTRTGQKIVFKRGALKQLVSVLRGGGKVALLLDQNTPPGEGGEFIRLFSRQAPTSKAAAALAGRTGAKLILAYCVADSAGNYTANASTKAAQENAVTQAIVNAIEAAIRMYPGQWMWSYKRWKYVPDGQSREGYPFYARPLNDGER